MATPGHEPRPGQAASTGAGVSTSGISPATTNAAMTGATPGVSTNPPSSPDTAKTSTAATGTGTAASTNSTTPNPITPDSTLGGMSSGDMARAASGADMTNAGRHDTGGISDRQGDLGRGATGSQRSTSGRADTEELRQQARSTGETLKSEAKRTAEALKEEARETVRQVANKQKQAAAGEMAGLSRALRRAADELEGQSNIPVDRYVRRAAQSLDELSESLQRRDVGSMIGRLEQYTREQPGVVFGGAIIAGFLLARLLRGPSSQVSDSGYRTDRFDNDVYH